jgi:hypothetical protein
VRDDCKFARAAPPGGAARDIKRKFAVRSAAADRRNLALEYPMSVALRIACLASLLIAAAPRGAAALPPTMPDTIYAYPYGGGPTADAERVLIASLQGVVAQTDPEIYMGSGSKWIIELVAMYPELDVIYLDTQGMLNRYAGQLDGYILYDSDTRNAANSLAGVLNAVIVDSATQHFATNAGLSLLVDVRDHDNLWVWNHYGHLFNRDYLFHNAESVTHHMRDLVAYRRGFIFYEDVEWPTYYAAQNPWGYVYGWAEQEYEFFLRGSTNNLMNAAANWMENGSVLTQWQVPIERQRTHTPPSNTTEPDVHYVAFVMSDGDNLQWLNAGFFMPQWWNSPHRGSFTMNWDLAPEFATANPHGFNYLYDTASRQEFKDYFINANGPATVYPSAVPDITGFAEINGAESARTDLTYMALLEENFDLAAWSAILADPRVGGAMLKLGPAYAGYDGAIWWFDGKPVVSVKHTMWDGFYTPDNLVATLNAAPRQPLSDEASYSLVNVHPWSTGFQGDPMSNVKYVVDRLDPAVRVVTVEAFMTHLRNNFGRPVYTDCNDNGLRDGDEVEARVVEYFDSSTSPAFSVNGVALAVDGLVELTDLQANTLGSVVFTEPTPEPADAFELAFDFRMGLGSGGEGVGAVLLDAALHDATAVFGETGPATGALAITFATQPGAGQPGPHAAIYLDGVPLVSAPVSASLNDSQFHRARFRLIDGLATLRYEVRRGIWETAFSDTPLPGYTPFVARLGFGARTSSLTQVHQVDHVELRQLLAADGNRNGVLDTCERPSDLNHDGVQDKLDVRWLLACLRGPDATPACNGAPAILADGDADGDLDLHDVATFQLDYEFTGTSGQVGPNLIYNPDVEAGGGDWPADWFHSATMTSWSSQHSNSPTRSLRIDDTRSWQSAEWRSRGVLLAGGEQQLRVAWHQRTGQMLGDWEVTIRFFDSVDQYGNAAGTFWGASVIELDVTPDADWTRYSFDATVPPQAGSFDVVFRSGAAGGDDFGAKGDLWLDDISVYELE